MLKWRFTDRMILRMKNHLPGAGKIKSNKVGKHHMTATIKK